MLSELFGTLTKILRSDSVQRKISSSLKNANPAKSISSDSRDPPQLPTAVGGTAISSVLSVVWYLSLLILGGCLIPLLLFAFRKSFDGAYVFVKKIERAIDLNTVDSPKRRFFRIFFRFIPEFITQWFRLLVIPLVTNIVTILALSIFIFMFVYFIERHMNDTINSISAASDGGVAFLNMGGHLVQFLYEGKMLFLPVTNMITRFQIFVAMHIYDGVRLTVENYERVANVFQGRRALNEITSDSILDFLTPMIRLFQVLYNLYLIVQTTIIDVFFQLQIVNVLLLVVDELLIITTQVLCLLTGFVCTFQEIGHFFVNTVIIGLLNLITSGFGFVIPDVNLACKAEELKALGVSKECSIVFSNAGDITRRRQLVTCRQVENEFIEDINGVPSLVRSFNQSIACPYSRAALTPSGNALNMKLLDTHDCYHVCAGDVLFKACSDGLFFNGSCTVGLDLGYSQGRRKLQSFFDFKTKLQKQNNEMFTEGVILSRSEMVQRMRDKVNAVTFNTDYGSCDLSSTPSNIYEMMYDAVCVGTRLFQKPTNRRILQAEPSLLANKLLPILNNMRHSLRIAKHSDESPLGVMNDFMKNGLSEKPQSRLRRRRLETICEDPKFLCPNDYQCEEDISLCVSEKTTSFLGTVRHYTYSATSYIDGLKWDEALYEIFQCWDGYRKNPETDPYAGLNLASSLEDLEKRAHWCVPMFKPGKYTFEPWTYSLRTEIYASCAAESPEFKSCQCPMYFALPSVSYPVLDFVSTDIGYILMNGLIYFKNIFVVITFDSVGFLWGSLCPQPTCSRQVSNALSLYSDEIPTSLYIICQGIHSGSAAMFLLFVFGVVQVSRFSLAMVSFVLSGGQNENERKVSEEARMMNIDGLEQRIKTLENGMKTE
jgi:hypothetical protein